MKNEMLKEIKQKNKIWKTFNILNHSDTLKFFDRIIKVELSFIFELQMYNNTLNKQHIVHTHAYTDTITFYGFIHSYIYSYIHSFIHTFIHPYINAAYNTSMYGNTTDTDPSSFYYIGLD